MKRWRRWRALSDPWLQGRLCFRVGSYWICCLLAVAVMLGLRVGLDANAQNSTEWWQTLWSRYGMVLAAPLLVLPIALIDCIIYTNRIIGPLRRLRLAIRLASRGEVVEPVVFRKGDLLAGTDVEFNILLDRLRKANQSGPGTKRATRAVANASPEDSILVAANELQAEFGVEGLVVANRA